MDKTIGFLLVQVVFISACAFFNKRLNDNEFFNKMFIASVLLFILAFVLVLFKPTDSYDGKFFEGFLIAPFFQMIHFKIFKHYYRKWQNRKPYLLSKGEPLQKVNGAERWLLDFSYTMSFLYFPSIVSLLIGLYIMPIVYNVSH